MLCVCYVLIIYTLIQDGETPFKIAKELGEKNIAQELIDNGATVEEVKSILYRVHMYVFFQILIP